jgi:hypothetical protein
MLLRRLRRGNGRAFREDGGIIRPTIGNSGLRAGARLASRRNGLIADHRRGDVLNFRYAAAALDVAAAASAWEGSRVFSEGGIIRPPSETQNSWPSPFAVPHQRGAPQTMALPIS